MFPQLVSSLMQIVHLDVEVTIIDNRLWDTLTYHWIFQSQKKRQGTAESYERKS